MSSEEKELARRERALREKEAELDARERRLSAFSAAVKNKKESWYEKVPLSLRQVDVIIWVVSALLAIVVVLIILEAAGIFKIG